MVNKKDKLFKPFLHEHLEIKNKLIEHARKLGTEGGDHLLSCALIYASFAEYIGEHLLENLRWLMYQITYNQFAGILFVDKTKGDDKKSLGHTIRELEKYNFPDKEDIIGLLKKINKSRNNLFHNLAKVNPDEMKTLDEDIEIIKEVGEELLTKINTIYIGLQKIIVQPSVGK